MRFFACFIIYFMALQATMNHYDYFSNICDDIDDHEHDMLMPGFRFHPTEEELIEFYLRRKVEGRRFNVELITFLDLYRYDPWELPALAAIGEKEWFFYAPRDRKYRNGNRPNRVTTSGYWKATGADKMIRGENSTSIGLKKTLVFYTGKAPKGIRTSWIMNEYRLPLHETERYQKAEISVCRVYKRPGVEDHPSLPGCAASKTSSSGAAAQLNRKKLKDVVSMEKYESYGGYSLHIESNFSIKTGGNNVASDVITVPGLSKDNVYRTVSPISTKLGGPAVAMNGHEILIEEATGVSSLAGASTNLFTGSPSLPCVGVDDLQTLLSYQQQQVSASFNQQEQNKNSQDQQSIQHFTLPQYKDELHCSANSSSFPASYLESLSERYSIAEAGKDYSNPFK